MWVVEKIRVSADKLPLTLPSAECSFRLGDVMFGERSERPRSRPLCPNVITPDSIPEFCIPPRVPSVHRPKVAEQGRATPIIRVSPCEWESPQAEESYQDPLGPRSIWADGADDACGASCSEEERTNADPQSQAALSLPHMARAQTCYGFCTLLESPHTRRKESLFHSDPGPLPLLLLPRSRSSTYSRSSASSSPSSSPSSFSLNALTSRLSPRGAPAVHCARMADSDTTSSTESSPFGSPLLGRCPAKSSIFKTLSHECLLSRNQCRAAVSRNNSLSTDEGSSTDNSPSVMRRVPDKATGGLPVGCGLVPPTFFPLDFTPHRERRMKESAVPLGKDGSLRLSAEFSPDNRRLRVRLISAEGLYSLAVDPKSINCSVSLSLVPGKLQKQRSTVIRKSRNPIFNEDFFFDGVTEEELYQRSLRFKVVNKMSTMKRDYVLGTCNLPLSSIVMV